MSNRHEEQARVRKATAIATVLDQAGVDSTHAAELAELHWQLAAAAAEVNLPSERSRAIVITILQERERLANTDPFDGLPS